MTAVARVTPGLAGAGALDGDPPAISHETLLDLVQEGVWATDRQHRIRYVNRALGLIAGVPAERILGRQVLAQFPADLLGDLAPLYLAALDHLVAVPYETRLPAPSGGQRWLAGTLTPILAEGRFAGLVATVVDRTAAKRDQQALAEREAWLGLAMSAGHAGAGEWQLDSGQLRLSPAGCQILGWNEPTASLAALFRRVVAKDRKRLRREWLAPREDSGHRVFEFRFRRPEHGATPWLRATIGCTGTAPDRAIGLIQDISEQRRAEEQGSRLAAIVNSSDDAVVGISLGHTISDWNPAAERIFGYGAAEAVGQPIACLVPPEELDRVGEIQADIFHGRRIDHFETQRLHRDGSRVDVSISAFPVFDPRGQVTGAAAIMRDIRARQRLAAARLEIHQRMEELQHHQVASHTLAALAHELGQPLSSIGFYVALAQDLLPRGDAADPLSQALWGVAAEVQRADAVVRGMIAQVLRPPAAREPVELHALIRTCIQNHRAAGRFPYPVEADLPGVAPVVVRANPQFAATVLDNLLNNGAEAMQGAGVAAEAGWLRISTQVDATMAQIRVQDQGPGLTPELAQQVFEPFFTTKPDGLGMGLPISRTLAQSQGGRLWCQPGPPGATFILTLPLAK